MRALNFFTVVFPVVGDRHHEHPGVRVQRLLHSGTGAEAEVGSTGDARRHAAARQEGLVRLLLPARTGAITF